MARNFNPPKSSSNTKYVDSRSTGDNAHIGLVTFSFKYLAVEHETFDFRGCNSAYFVSCICRLKHVSCFKCSELKYPTVKALRNHFIRWEDTSQKCFGLPNEEQLVERPFQFGVSANEHGRVIGFFIDTTFYVVWLDVEHQMYA